MEKIKKTLEDVEIKSIDEETRTIWHKITVEKRDLIGDIVRIDGIDTSKFRKKPAVLYGHSYVGINPVPVIAENVGFKKEGKALYAGTKFLDSSDLSQNLKDLINDLWILNKKKLMGWSIGFKPTETEDLKDEKDENVIGKDFKKSLLLEYSNVIIPANQDAINDAISKGIVSDNLKASLKDIQAEDEVTDKDIGTIVETIDVDGNTQEKDIFFQETEPVDELKPYPNEHSCRLKEPGKYEKFRRGKRKHDGKTYIIIFGKVKGKDEWEQQAFRYPIKEWSEAEARKHCRDHDGIKFEPAKPEKKSTQLQDGLPSETIKELHVIMRAYENLNQQIIKILSYFFNGGKK